MKASEIRSLTKAEIEAKIVELKEELFNLKFQQALGSLENPARITEIKRTIARMKTILTEGSFAAEKKEVKKAKKAAKAAEAKAEEPVVEEAPKAKKTTKKAAAKEEATEEAPKPKKTRAKKTTSSDAE
jgi:large subunit ribosomal protein L29